MLSYLVPCLVSFCLTYTLLYFMSVYGNFRATQNKHQNDK
jgi:hypothetical protein